jgi:hypothetical protein
MGGPRLTPEQLDTAAEVFARTNNISEAAASIGVNESTLRAAFQRVRIARNRDLHRKAVERGLRRGRKHLADAANLLGEQLVTELRSGGLEPLERLQCAGALGTVMRELVRLRLLDLKIQQAALTRAQTRASTKRILAAVEHDGDAPALSIPLFLLTERPDNDGAAADDDQKEGLG